MNDFKVLLTVFVVPFGCLAILACLVLVVVVLRQAVDVDNLHNIAATYHSLTACRSLTSV